MHSSRKRTGCSLNICWCLLQGWCLLRGWCLLQGGVCSGGCLLWGVSAQGVSARRGCLLLGVVSQHALRQTPISCGQNHRHEEKHNLGNNFVAASKNVTSPETKGVPSLYSSFLFKQSQERLGRLRQILETLDSICGTGRARLIRRSTLFEVSVKCFCYHFMLKMHG